MMEFFNNPHPTWLTESKPLANKHSFIHSFDLALLNPTPSQSLFFNPCEAKTKMGIITSKKIPQICHCPLFTRAGKVLVTFNIAHSNVALSQIEIGKLEQFHRFYLKKSFFQTGKKWDLTWNTLAANISLRPFSEKTTHWTSLLLTKS